MHKYKFYYRKSSFKKDKISAYKLLEELAKYSPQNVLEIGVLQGVTARNFCDLLYKIHNKDFKYIGIDLFSKVNNSDRNEFTPIHNKISNPLKNFYFNYILKEDLNSIESVQKLLKKYSQNVKLFKGFSHIWVKDLDLDMIEFVFLDGGHSYETVKKDLELLTSKLKKGSIIICDDYNQKEFGVFKAVNELKEIFTVNMVNERFAKIII